MTNQEISAVFGRIADMLEFQGANPFRIRAYRNGARRIADLRESLATIVSEPSRSLTDIEGIGKDVASKIVMLLESGSFPMLDELLAEIRPTTLALLRVPGLGPKKAALLHRELGVASLDDLRRACESQRVRVLKGFGPKTEESIMQGLDIAAAAERRTRWADADLVVAELLAHMRAVDGIRQMEIAGSYRRGCETVGDLDLLVDGSDSASVMDRLGSMPQVALVIARGDTKMSVRLNSGMQIDLRVVPTESFGAALQYFTGSKDHNVLVRRRAKQQGLKVNEWGVFRIEPDGKESYLAGRNEEEVYAAVGLPCFAPPLREARQEFEWAKTDAIPELVQLADIRGDLHMHTTATDGKSSLREMVDAARARGLEYIAITDHSQRVSMARGLNPTRLRAQWVEIERMRKEVEDIAILKGIECDILEKGGMDLPDDVLAEADWVVASIHYGQKQSAEQITDRIMGALENPHVHIIAHPTGRLINRRNPYAVDMNQVFLAAAKHGKFLELNANPARLDLHEIHCATAQQHGIPIVISTDAHSSEGLDVMRYGILQAQRGGLTPADVANTMPWQEFSKRLR